MRNFVFSLFAAMAVLLMAPQSASASTYETYHCGCTAPKDESCWCGYGYTLGKLGTKEFRGYCDNIGGHEPHPEIHINDLNKNTTCTISNYTAPYTSKSCTNWSMTTSDSIDVALKCTNQ